MVVLFSSLLRFYGLSGGFQCSLGSGTKPTQTLSSPGGTQSTAAQLPVTPLSHDSGSTTTRRNTTTRDSKAKKIAAQKSAKVSALKDEASVKESSTLSTVNWDKITKLGIRRVPVPKLSRFTVKSALSDYLMKLESDAMDEGDVHDPSELSQTQSKWDEIADDILAEHKKSIKNGHPNPECYARGFIDQYLKHLMGYTADRVRVFRSYTISPSERKSKKHASSSTAQDCASSQYTTHPSASDVWMQDVEQTGDAELDAGIDEEMEHSDSGATNEPVVLTHNGLSMTLRGHVDYAVYRMRNGSEMIFNGIAGASSFNLHTTSRDLQLKSNRDILFFPIEAKRLQGKLESHIPQVLAEALVIMKKIERDATSWILSNGCEWIFGISRMPIPTEGVGPLEASYMAVTIQPLWDKKVGLFDTANPGSATERLAFSRLSRQAETVWMLLNLWTFIEPGELKQLIGSRRC